MYAKRIGLVIGLLAIALVAQGSASAAVAAEVVVRLETEGQLRPVSAMGREPMPGLPVRLFDGAGALVAEATTDDDGAARLEVAPGDYALRYGGAVTATGRSAARQSRPLRVPPDGVDLDLTVPVIGWHVHDQGGPMELERMDMDPSLAGDQRVARVARGARVTVEVAWWERSTVNVPVYYVSLFGEWQPTEALARLAHGVASPSSNRLHRHVVTFAAPSSPGTYRVRLVDVLDYKWPPSFHTARHYEPALGRDMYVKIIGRDDFETFGEGTLMVEGPGIAELREAVREAGLAPHVGRLLNLMLDRAEAALDSGDDGQAIAWLERFAQTVGQLTRRWIDPETAGALIALAEQVTAAIRGS